LFRKVLAALFTSSQEQSPDCSSVPDIGQLNPGPLLSQAIHLAEKNLYKAYELITEHFFGS